MLDVIGRAATEISGVALSSRENAVAVRAIGINHVALEVGSVDEALEWYGRFLDFELRGRGPRSAFIDLGDQFLALSEGRTQGPDDGRHFGLVVTDKERLRDDLTLLGIETSGGRALRVRDPWGNVAEIVDYRAVQFTKSSQVLDALGLGDLQKSEAALAELAAKGIQP